MSNLLNELFPGLDARVVLQDILGIREITNNGDELIHSCPLPFGMHRNGDLSPSASLNSETLLFNCFTCFSPETKVMTPGGFKRIDELLIGDLVLTHEGRYRPIKTVFKNSFDGELIGINTWGQKDTVWSTPNHPFFAAKKRWCSKHGKLGCRSNGCNNAPKPTLDWINAEELVEKEWLLAKQTIKEVIDIDYIDMPTRNVRSMMRSNYKQKNIGVTESFCRLMGYYFAEGFCVGRNSVAFCFNADETFYKEDVEHIAKELGLSIKYTKGSENNWQYGYVDYLHINSRALVDLIIREFGTGSKEKKLPMWFMTLPIHKQKEFMKGILRGDGCITDRSVALVLANPVLIYQVWQILARMGVYATLGTNTGKPWKIKERKGIGAKTGIIEWYSSKEPNLFKEICGVDPVSRQKMPPSHEWVTEQGLISSSIRMRVSKPYSGYVYNLEVEEDNTYVVETLVVHNCGGGSVIWLVQNCLNVSRDDAIAVLKDEVTDLKVVPLEDFVKKLEGVFDNDKKSSLEIPHYSENLLKRWEGPCDYLSRRSVSLDVQRRMRTGIEKNRLEIAKTPAGEVTVQVDRVVLPHFIKGKLSGWVARKIEEVVGVPKYRNSKGFPRGAWLYNLDNAKSYKEVYVMESPMSVLVLKSRGIENVVATFGAKVDANQIDLLRNFSAVNIFMDGDAPGWKATDHLVEALSNYTNVRVVKTPDGEDPASLSEIPATISQIEWLQKDLTYAN